MIVVSIVAAVFVILCLVAYVQQRMHPEGYDAVPEDVRKSLEAIVDGSDPHALDDFICVPLKDPRLEAIRQRVAQLDQEFPPEAKGQFCNPRGIEIIRQYIQELGAKI